jgi:multiple sugar transport system substrate-binding protein
LDRRKFLKYTALVGGAAVVAGTLGYEALLSPRNMPTAPATPARTTSPRSSTTSASTSPAGSALNTSGFTSDYAEFMEWLADASKPYRGTTLNLSMESEPYYLAVQSRDPDFFLATGINDSYNIQPYSLQLATTTLLVNTSAPTYDAYTVDHQDVAEFKDYILSPTDLAEKYPDLTYEKISPQDFGAVPWSVMAVYPPDLSFNYGGSSPGTVYFIPGNCPVTIQFYRDDLYQTYGLSVAKTWDDYLSNVKALYSPVNPIRFGCVDMASFSVFIVEEYLNHLKSFGGDLWEVNDGQLATGLGSDAALAALENFVRFEPYSDTGSAFYTQDNITTDIALDIAANALQYGDYAYYQDDNFRSLVAGKVDYAPNPSGPQGSFSTWEGGGVGISKFSKNPEAAWLWLQWATSLGLEEMITMGTYKSFPSRKAVLSNSLVQQSLGTAAARSLNVVNQVWSSGRVATLATFPRWWDALQEISFYLNNAWQGQQTPQQALTQAVQKVEALGTLTF